MRRQAGVDDEWERVAGHMYRRAWRILGMARVMSPEARALLDLTMALIDVREFERCTRMPHPNRDRALRNLVNAIYERTGEASGGSAAH